MLLHCLLFSTADSIKIEHACIPLLEAWAVFGTAAIKKIISIAAWQSIIFLLHCGAGYLI
jgi:hypothetical protein